MNKKNKAKNNNNHLYLKTIILSLKTRNPQYIILIAAMTSYITCMSHPSIVEESCAWEWDSSFWKSDSKNRHILKCFMYIFFIDNTFEYSL